MYIYMYIYIYICIYTYIYTYTNIIDHIAISCVSAFLVAVKC